MDHFKFNEALVEGRVEWRRHAIERLLSRGYHRAEILEGLREALILEEYLEDKPYTSALFLDFQQVIGCFIWLPHLTGRRSILLLYMNLIRIISKRISERESNHDQTGIC